MLLAFCRVCLKHILSLCYCGPLVSQIWEQFHVPSGVLFCELLVHVKDHQMLTANVTCSCLSWLEVFNVKVTFSFLLHCPWRGTGISCKCGSPNLFSRGFKPVQALSDASVAAHEFNCHELEVVVAVFYWQLDQDFLGGMIICSRKRPQSYHCSLCLLDD